MPAHPCHLPPAATPSETQSYWYRKDAAVTAHPTPGDRVTYRLNGILGTVKKVSSTGNFVTVKWDNGQTTDMPIERVERVS